MKTLLAESGDLDVTFHKAFDAVDDQSAALEVIKRYPEITTILTSGGKGASVDNKATLKALIEKTEGTPLTIMPGGGLNTENVPQLMAALTPDALHFGTGIRAGGTYGGRISEALVQAVRNAVE